MGDRCTEERHDPVAGVLIDRAFEAVNLRGDELKAAVDDPVHLLWIKLFRKRSESGDVSEEYGDLTAFALKRGSGSQDLFGEMLWRVRGDGRCRR